jgi:hypothetical protein
VSAGTPPRRWTASQLSSDAGPSETRARTCGLRRAQGAVPSPHTTIRDLHNVRNDAARCTVAVAAPGMARGRLVSWPTFAAGCQTPACRSASKRSRILPRSR